MISEDIVEEVLKFMYDDYQKGPGKPANLTPIATSHKLYDKDLARELEILGYVRGIEHYPNATHVTITIDGMMKVDPATIAGQIQDILEGLEHGGGKGNVMEILGYDIQWYSKARDLAKHLEGEGMVEIDLQRFSEKEMRISFTESGRKKYEAEKPTFFNM